MKEIDVRLGAKVKTNVDFVSVPTGSTGVIVDDYGTGVMVEWDNIESGMRGKKLVDGFGKEHDLQFLDLV